MKKFKVTKTGVVDKEGKPVEVGTTIESETLPKYLVGKVTELQLEVATPKPKTASK